MKKKDIMFIIGYAFCIAMFLIVLLIEDVTCWSK